MNAPFHEFFVGLWVLLAVLICVLLFQVRRVFMYLEAQHNPTWVKLGEPSLFLNNSLKNNYLFLRFLVTREFRALQDARLDSKCRGLLFLYAAATALFVVVLLFLLLLYGGKLTWFFQILK